jgi:hypothetical protein
VTFIVIIAPLLIIRLSSLPPLQFGFIFRLVVSTVLWLNELLVGGAALTSGYRIHKLQQRHKRRYRNNLHRCKARITENTVEK